MARSDIDVLVIGGGFYGCCLALYLRRRLGRSPILVDAGDRLLGRASWANQARIHNGYHYPRSVVTAHRSRVNVPRFLEDFGDCVDDGFEKYYAIGRRFSKVTAAQFRLFCQRIGAPIEPAPDEVRDLFDRELIEDVFLVQEMAFDAERLRARLGTLLSEAGVDVILGAEAVRVGASDGDRLAVELREGSASRTVECGEVFNCTYSRMNQLLDASELPLIPLKHELTEMAVVDVPAPLEKLGVTVMCGPFFSVMPFPPLGAHSFSHVRYTPHCAWHDEPGRPYVDPYARFRELPHESRFLHMVKDAQRYLPALAECRYRRSIWEVKTVLPRNEVDDGRPILLKRDHGLRHLTCVMGSKIDNVYDVLEFLDARAS